MSNLSNFFNEDTGQRVIGELVYLPTTEKYNVPNNGFLRCDGSAVSKTTYANLHSVLGIYPDTFDTTKSFITRTLATMNDLIYANNIFVGVTNMATTRAYAVTSTNSITWSNVILDTGVDEFNNDALAITSKRINSSLTYFVIVGENGELMTTNDFQTITSRLSGTTSTIRTVITGDGGSVQYVYAGDGGLLATSDNSNGSGWTLRTSGTSSNIRALLYGGSRYVYAGDGGVLATSTDGITWSTKSSGTTSTIYTINYENGLYVYAGDGGVMATSTDANTWTQISSGTTNTIYKVKSNGYISVYYTQSGEIGFSGDNQNWNVISEESGISAITLTQNEIVYSYGTTANLVVASPFSYDASTNFKLPNTIRNSANSEYLYVKY